MSRCPGGQPASHWPSPGGPPLIGREINWFCCHGRTGIGQRLLRPELGAESAAAADTDQLTARRTGGRGGQRRPCSVWRAGGGAGGRGWRGGARRPLDCQNSEWSDPRQQQQWDQQQSRAAAAGTADPPVLQRGAAGDNAGYGDLCRVQQTDRRPVRAAGGRQLPAPGLPQVRRLPRPPHRLLLLQVRAVLLQAGLLPPVRAALLRLPTGLELSVKFRETQFLEYAPTPFLSSCLKHLLVISHFKNLLILIS